MLNPNEILFETTDIKLAKALLKEKFEGINIGIYQTRAGEFDYIAKFIIEFLSDAGLVYFGHWLGTRHSKKAIDKTTINENEIPQDVEQITTLIKRELKKIQEEQSEDDE